MVAPRSGVAGLVAGSVDWVGVLMVFFVKKAPRLAALRPTDKE